MSSKARVWTLTSHYSYDHDDFKWSIKTPVLRNTSALPEELDVIEKSYADELEQRLLLATEALEFYANKQNWDDRWIDEDPEREGDIFDIITREDVEIKEDKDGKFLTYGGEKAREALAKLKEKP